jgi:hypothetical protein
MNEAFEVAGSPSGLSRYFIRDDLAGGLAGLKEGDLIAQDGGLRAAVVGDVAIGDIDGDNVGEVVLGGITNMQTSGNQPLGEIALALDDAAHGFTTLAAKYLAHYVQGDNDISPNTYRTAFVMTGDLDGDLIDEIVVNHYVFDDFVATKGLSSAFGDAGAWVTRDAGERRISLQRALRRDGRGRRHLRWLRGHPRPPAGLRQYRRLRLRAQRPAERRALSAPGRHSDRGSEHQ